MDRKTMRIAMIVDNAVTGDSRVIKAARSVAAAGFDVTVLGHGPQSQKDIQGTTATLVPGMPAVREGRFFKWILRNVAMDPGDVRAFRLAKSAGRLRGLSGAVQRGSVGIRWRLNRFAGYGSRELARAFALAEKYPETGARFGFWEQLDPLVASINRGMFLPLVELEPDLIHIHDFRMLPVAVAARHELRRRGRDTRLVYDAHEYVPGLVELGENRHRAAGIIERKYIHSADAVVSVSDDLAKRMREDHSLAELPIVVLNAPEVPGTRAPGKGLRERLGLAEGTPLAVYSGSVGKTRLLTHCVDILALLPELHVALVVSHPASNVMEELKSRAEELGVRDRFHLTRYVPAESIVDFLSGADIGLVPLQHTENVQDSLPSKTYEYLAARVPQVVSNQRAMGAFVSSNGIGEVFPAEDAAAMASAVRAVLADPGRYRDAMTDELLQTADWAVQAQKLVDLYDHLLTGLTNPPRTPVDAEPVDDSSKDPQPEHLVDLMSELDFPEPSPVRLGIMPQNSAGQGRAWAATASTLPGVAAQNYALRRVSHLQFPADFSFTSAQSRDVRLQLQALEALKATHTHVLLEAGWTPLEHAYAPLPVGHVVDELEGAGVTVGQVFHGSEVRIPSIHAQLFQHSNLADADDPYIRTLETRAVSTVETAKWLGLPQFVSTPDQIDYLPEAQWLPVVVSHKPMPERELFQSDLPIVLHAPSNGRLKGSETILAVLEKLEAAGVIRLLQVNGASPNTMAQLFSMVDVVVDQIGMGLYGVAACEAMSAGCITLAEVGDRLRSRVPDDIPIVDVDADTLEEQIVDIAERPDAYRDLPRRGREFVTKWHDGRASAQVLAPFLGLTP